MHLETAATSDSRKEKTIIERRGEDTYQKVEKKTQMHIELQQK
jgi:hypothetical protein